MNSSSIMTVQGGRITTNVAMLPDALRNNRPSRSESAIAAEVIEQLHAEVMAARNAGFLMVSASAGESAAKPMRQPEPSAQEAPDPAVVTQEDLSTLLEVEEMVRSSGLEDKADRLLSLHSVLLRVSQGREASHFKESYERAVERLVKMRTLVPEQTIRAFEVEWRKHRRDPVGDAAALELSEELRGELRQMAHHCGAVSYSPPPMRAVRGVSLTFEQLEAFALLVSGAMWPVPGVELR